MKECPDPLNVLFKPCFQNDSCPENALSDKDFPFLTSVDEAPPNWGDFLLFRKWLPRVLISTILTAVLVYDVVELIFGFDLVPEPFDDSIVQYISSIAIGTYILAQYQFLTSVGINQAAEYRNMVNAVTSFGHDLAGAFTMNKANKLLDSTFEMKVWTESCTGPGEVVEVPGSVMLCYLAALTQSAIYGTTRGLDTDGILIDRLPLIFQPLYNEVKRYTSPRNQDQLSTIMEMALRLVEYMVEGGVIDPQAWSTASKNVGDFNTAIGNIGIAKDIRPNPWSNNFLGLIIAITVAFIPLSTPFTNEWKVVVGFLIAFVFQYTLALREAEANITNVSNKLAGIRLKDEDDGGAYGVVVSISKIADMASTEDTPFININMALLKPLKPFESPFGPHQA